jgi:molybdopterin synthase sulfur carrier subunit
LDTTGNSKRWALRYKPETAHERLGDLSDRCLPDKKREVRAMAVKVRIPTPLQRLTQGKEEVEGVPGTIIEIVADLDKRFPGIGERISEGGKIRRFVNIYVNEEDIRFLKAEATTVKDGDEVSIVPAIAGGILTVNSVSS